MFPYSIKRVHQLKQPDYAQAAAFSHLCVHHMSSDPSLLRQIVYSDGCVSHISALVDTQNLPNCGNENAGEIQKHELHTEDVTDRSIVLDNMYCKAKLF